MPSKATVSGVMQDANLQPISGGKVIATFNGSDIFDSGVRIVTQKVEATTDANGAWSLELIVNAEGANASTTWAIEGFNQFVGSVFKTANLFIATGADITLGDLEKSSVQNMAAARSAGTSRLLIVDHLDDYTDLPTSQRRDTDVILVPEA